MSMKKDGAERKNGIIAFYRRFMNIFYPFYTKFTDDNIFAIAGQSAFFLTLSIVPLVIFTVSLMQGLHVPVEFIRASFGKILSENDTNRMIDYLDNVYESSVGVSVVSLVFTLWSAAKGIHAITNGLNRIHVAFESRNWFLLRLRSMGYTLVFFLVLLVTMTTVVFGDSINRMVSPHLKYFPFVLALVYYLRYVIVFLYMILMFAMIRDALPASGRGFFGGIVGSARVGNRNLRQRFQRLLDLRRTHPNSGADGVAVLLYGLPYARRGVQFRFPRKDRPRDGKVFSPSKIFRQETKLY